ncbi:hypothetical protein OC846_005713 [Tilletia horrida]|uniref:Uncharacterized protein n=1 Tax=Tilletia horrida TaxID=155126 RepID=A0AAN6JRF4_9BASI|nr:hypothetical protein OC846_005713 [Tilletia horrida]KAK0561378.1 hypothetical protein OC861_005846 [Tilletia horrida]
MTPPPPPSAAAASATTTAEAPPASPSATILLSAPPPPAPRQGLTATKQHGRTRSAAAQAINQTSSSNQTLGSILLASISRPAKSPSSPTDVEAQLRPPPPPEREEEQPEYFTIGATEQDDDDDDHPTVSPLSRANQKSHAQPLRSAKHSSDPPSSATTASYDEIGSSYWDPAAEASAVLEDTYELEEYQRPQRSTTRPEPEPEAEDPSQVYTSESAALLPNASGVHTQTSIPALQQNKSAEAPPFETLSRQEKTWMSIVTALVGALAIVALLISEDFIDWPGDGIGKD